MMYNKFKQVPWKKIYEKEWINEEERCNSSNKERIEKGNMPSATELLQMTRDRKECSSMAANVFRGTAMQKY